MSDTARAAAEMCFEKLCEWDALSGQTATANFIIREIERRLDTYAAEQTAALRAALKTLIGQVEQARDGFGIWPYTNSASMALTLNEARALLADPEGQGRSES